MQQQRLYKNNNFPFAPSARATLMVTPYRTGNARGRPCVPAMRLTGPDRGLPPFHAQLRRAISSPDEAACDKMTILCRVAVLPVAAHVLSARGEGAGRGGGLPASRARYLRRCPRPCTSCSRPRCAGLLAAPTSIGMDREDACRFAS